MPQKIAPACLALLGAILVLLRRRDAIWYLAGWGVITLVMNPKLIGINRTGVIDEIHWKFAVQTAIGAMAGLAVGVLCETIRKRRTLIWNIIPAIAALSLAIWGATSAPAVPQSSRFVLHDDVRMMSWIRHNIPPNEKIAARSFFNHEQAQGYDAAAWLPYFTRHQTNQTPLAAALEKAPVDARENIRRFARDLYRRDMSTRESAQWMAMNGFRWFFAGAILPEKDAQLLEQISRNPAIHLAHAEGRARLYHID